MLNELERIEDFLRLRIEEIDIEIIKMNAKKDAYKQSLSMVQQSINREKLAIEKITQQT